MNIKQYFVGAWLAGAMMMGLGACTSVPENATQVNQLPKLYPDYVGVTVPTQIAPLDFGMVDDGVETIDVVIKGSKTGELHSNGDYADFDIDEWHNLLEQNKGGKLSVTVSTEKDGKWTQYKDFDIHVSPYALDDWGLTYRRIAPGYEVYGKLGIYQRNLSNFEETAILENTAAPGACLNCHTANRTNPDQFTFHVRGDHGATLVSQNGKREWLKAKNDSLKGSMVYPYWHPSGKYCAYSTNTTHQSFHANADKRLEVYDSKSDVYVADLDNNRIISSPLISDSTHLETFPTFSPDGKYVYYCVANRKGLESTNLKGLKYSLVRIPFDEKTGSFGTEVDTLYKERSVCHPKISPDGRYCLFTVADYGTFPIWHPEADLYMLDLQTGKVDSLSVVNSEKSDTYHSWSHTGRWFVFASKRDDGLYGKPYFCYVDRQGKAHKPFVLPQREPTFYDDCLKSFNIPELSRGPVPFDAIDIENVMKQEAEKFK